MLHRHDDFDGDGDDQSSDQGFSYIAGAQCEGLSSGATPLRLIGGRGRSIHMTFSLSTVAGPASNGLIPTSLPKRVIFTGPEIFGGAEIRRLTAAGYAIRVVERHDRTAGEDDTARLASLLRQDTDIDWLGSWFLCADAADIEMAWRMRVKSILLRIGQQSTALSTPPEFECPDVAAAARFILDLWPAIEPRAAAIGAHINPGETVAIAGAARTGKSSWASALALTLRARGRPAVVIGLDGWICDISRRPADATVRERYDMQGLAALARTLRHEDGVTVPLYDRLTRTRRSAYRAPVDGQDIIILEGVVALMVKDIEKIAAHRIFVQQSEAARHQTMLADYLSRGYAPAEFERLYRRRLADEMPFVLESREHATIVIDAIK